MPSTMYAQRPHASGPPCRTSSLRTITTPTTTAVAATRGAASRRRRLLPARTRTAAGPVGGSSATGEDPGRIGRIRVGAAEPMLVVDDAERVVVPDGLRGPTP